MNEIDKMMVELKCIQTDLGICIFLNNTLIMGQHKDNSKIEWQEISEIPLYKFMQALDVKIEYDNKGKI